MFLRCILRFAREQLSEFRLAFDNAYVNAGQTHYHLGNIVPVSFHNNAGIQNDIDAPKALGTTQV